MSATGYVAQHLPHGPELEEVLGLIRVGVKFSAQRGGKPGFMHWYLLGLVDGMGGDLSFERLLLELRFEARKRALLGPEKSPIERVDDSFELLTWHDPRRGRRQMPFGSLRNAWTVVRKKVL